MTQIHWLIALLPLLLFPFLHPLFSRSYECPACGREIGPANHKSSTWRQALACVSACPHCGVLIGPDAAVHTVPIGWLTIAKFRKAQILIFGVGVGFALLVYVWEPKLNRSEAVQAPVLRKVEVQALPR